MDKVRVFNLTTGMITICKREHIIKVINDGDFFTMTAIKKPQSLAEVLGL